MHDDAVNTSATRAVKCQPWKCWPLMSLFQYTHSNYEAEQHKNAPLCLSPRQSTSDLARKSTCLLGAGLVPTILPCLASCADKCRRRCGFHGSLCRSLPAVQASAVSETWLMVTQQLHNGLCCRFSTYLTRRFVPVKQQQKRVGQSQWQKKTKRRTCDAQLH